MTTPAATTTAPVQTYEIRLAVPTWAVTLAPKLLLCAAIFAFGVLVGRGKLALPSWPFAPKPAPTPARPDWAPDNPPPFNPTPLPNQPSAWEWRTLPSDPKWEGYGRDVEGEFLIQTWRRKEQPPTAQIGPPPIVQSPRPTAMTRPVDPPRVAAPMLSFAPQASPVFYPRFAPSLSSFGAFCRTGSS